MSISNNVILFSIQASKYPLLLFFLSIESVRLSGMQITQLQLLHFKNHRSLELSFHPKINALCGNNGKGKTNVLDAIHYLSVCKSYINPIDKQNILHGESFFSISGSFIDEKDSFELLCMFKEGNKKVFKKNQVKYEKLSDHIGVFPVVFVSPYDGDLIAERGEIRRRWVDSVLSQVDRNYLTNLIQFQRLLLQRNAVLKRIHTNQEALNSLEIWDEQLVLISEQLHKRRGIFIEAFLPIFNAQYTLLGEPSEQVEISYRSDLNDGDFAVKLQHSLERDVHLQYTSHGIQRDDFLFSLNGFPIKKFGSQGQQKSFIIALRLAQYQFIKDAIGKCPVLLLDDVFDRLDFSRVKRLLDIVNQSQYGQVIISDTDPKRLEKLLNEKTIDYTIITLSN